MPKVTEYGGNRQSSQVVTGARATSVGGGGLRPTRAPTSTLPGLQAKLARNDRSAQIRQQGNDAVVKGLSDVALGVIQFQQRANETAAEEALLKFERDKNNLFFNPESGYFNSQGRNAYDGGESTLKALDDLKKQYSDELSTESRQMFEKAASVHITRATTDVHRHASKGFKAWESATSQAQVENAIENAAYYHNQPDQLAVQNQLGRQAIIDQATRDGIGNEATAERLQTFDSEFAKSTINAAVSQGSQAGKAAFDKYADLLEGAEKQKFKTKIDNKAKVENNRFNAQHSILTGTRLSNLYDDRESIRKEVNKIKDPELRKSTMREAMYQFNLKKDAENEAQAEAFESAEEHLLSGGSVEAFQANNAEAWDKLSAKQKRSISTGNTVNTDWNTYSDIMTMSNDQLAKLNPTDYFDKLGVSERKKVISAVKSAKGSGSKANKIDHQVGRSRTSQTTAALEKMFGKKSKWSNSDRDKAEAFYSLLDEEVTQRESQNDGSLTSEQFTQLLSQLTADVVSKKTFMGIDVLRPDVKDNLSDVKPNEVMALSRFLRENGVPVTAETILEARRQAR